MVCITLKVGIPEQTSEGNDSASQSWFHGLSLGKKRSWKQRAKLFLIAFAILCVAVFTVARIRFHGAPLGELVEDILNESIRGEVSVESIEWPAFALPRFVWGGWVPVHLKNVEVLDERGVAVIRAPNVKAEIDTFSLMYGGGPDFVFRNIVVEPGAYTRIEQINVPEFYREHKYDVQAISLVSAFYGKEEHRIELGTDGGRSSVFDLRNFHATGVEVDFIGRSSSTQEETISINFKDVETKGFLYYSGADPINSRMYYSLSPTAQAATVKINGAPHETVLRDVYIDKLEQLPANWPRHGFPNAMEFAMRATTKEGAKIVLDGQIEDDWGYLYGGDYDVNIQVENAGALLQKWTGGFASGQDFAFRASVSGPTLLPTYKLNATNIDISVPNCVEPYSAEIEKLEIILDDATTQGSIPPTDIHVGGGVATIQALFNTAPFNVDAKVSIARQNKIDLTPCIPRSARAYTGRPYASGEFSAVLGSDSQRLRFAGLQIGRVRVGGSVLRRANDASDMINTEQLKVSMLGTGATFSGSVNLESKQLALAIDDISSDNLHPILRFFDTPPIARTVSGSGNISGTLDDPKTKVSFVATEIPVLGAIYSQLSYQDDRIQVESLRDPRSESIKGSGAITLGRRPKIRDFSLTIDNLKLDNQPGVPTAVTGSVSGGVKLNGPMDSLNGELKFQGENLAVLGDLLTSAETSILLKDGTIDSSFQVERQNGGAASGKLSLDKNSQLSGELSLKDLVIQSLLSPEIPYDSIVGGTVSGKIDINGTTDAPKLSGKLNVTRSWVMNAMSGLLEITLHPSPNAGNHIVVARNSTRDIEVSAQVSMFPPFINDATLTLRRADLDRFYPTLAEEYGATGFISGTIQIGHTKTGQITAEANLHELVIQRDQLDTVEVPIRLSNSNPIQLRFDGKNVNLLEPVKFEGTGGEFTLSGKVENDQLDVFFSGDLNVALFRPYLRSYVDSIDGAIRLDFTATGPITEPNFGVIANIQKINARPIGQDIIVTIERARAILNRNQLALEGMDVFVTDPFTQQKSELLVSAQASLKDYRPSRWVADIEGSLPGALLQALMPAAISQGQGFAEIALTIDGEEEDISAVGDILLETERPIKLTPRGLRREIAFETGLVDVQSNEICLENITAVIDSEGKLGIGKNNSCAGGRTSVIGLDGILPKDVDIEFWADDIPYRIPRKLDITFNVPTARIIGDVEEGLSVEGDIDVVNGIYNQPFDVVSFLPKRETGQSDRPDEALPPLIQNTALNLNLNIRAFFIRNNIAEIELVSSRMHILGTPGDPRLDGTIEVSNGSFKPPTLRANFTRTSGSLTFSQSKKLGEGTPDVRITSEADYRDQGGADHLVTLTFNGAFPELVWDLTTSTGLDKAQTLLFLLSGRSPEELRRQLGDDSPGLNTDPRLVGAASSDSFVDNVIKDLASPLLTSRLNTLLKDATQLDIVRISLGTSSVAIHTELHLLNSNAKLLYDFESDGSAILNSVRANYRLSDNFSLDANYQSRSFSNSQELDITALRAQLVYRLLVK